MSVERQYALGEGYSSRKDSINEQDEKADERIAANVTAVIHRRVD